MRSLRAKPDEAINRLLQRMRQVREALCRCVLFLNGKGGTGKTSTCANCGGVLAADLVANGSDLRVLLLEFDLQGNLKSEVGQKGTPGDDDGQSMVNAAMGAGPLNVIRDVRPQLDIIPGGERLERLAKLLAASNDLERAELWVQFLEALADIAHEYAWILIDCPPGDKELQKLAAVLGYFIIIPTVFDKYSRYGLEKVGKLFEDIGEFNEDIDVLGVLMFAFERREQRAVKDEETGEIIDYTEVGQRQRLRRVLERDLERAGSEAPVFKTVISNNKIAGEVCRELGILAYELADMVESGQWRKTSKQLADVDHLGGMVALNAVTAEGLASEYEELTIEAFQLANKRLEEEGAKA